jgi:hypothetical protein
MTTATITITLTPDQMINIINDYGQRLDVYAREDGCDAYHGNDPIVKAFGTFGPCTCRDDTKQARATIEYLRSQFKAQAPTSYWLYYGSRGGKP